MQKKSFGRSMMQSPVKIRTLEPQDQANFSLLLSEEFQMQNLQEVRARVSACYQMMEKTKTLTVLVGAKSTHIIGYIVIHWLENFWASTPEAFITSLYVRLAYRRKGVGGLLLEKAIDEARIRKASRVFLENSRKNITYNTKFYHRRGWQERFDSAIFEFKFPANESLD